MVAFIFPDHVFSEQFNRTADQYADDPIARHRTPSCSWVYRIDASGLYRLTKRVIFASKSLKELDRRAIFDFRYALSSAI